jgi:hypothetical protein
MKVLWLLLIASIVSPAEAQVRPAPRASITDTAAVIVRAFNYTATDVFLTWHQGPGVFRWMGTVTPGHTRTFVIPSDTLGGATALVFTAANNEGVVEDSQVFPRDSTRILLIRLDFGDPPKGHGTKGGVDPSPPTVRTDG